MRAGLNAVVTGRACWQRFVPFISVRYGQHLLAGYSMQVDRCRRRNAGSLDCCYLWLCGDKNVGVSGVFYRIPMMLRHDAPYDKHTSTPHNPIKPSRICSAGTGAFGAAAADANDGSVPVFWGSLVLMPMKGTDFD